MIQHNESIVMISDSALIFMCHVYNDLHKMVQFLLIVLCPLEFTSAVLDDQNVPPEACVNPTED